MIQTTWRGVESALIGSDGPLCGLRTRLVSATPKRIDHSDDVDVQKSKSPDHEGIQIAPSHSDSKRFEDGYEYFHLEQIETVLCGCETA